MPPEHPGVGGEPGEAEEVFSYWFPENLAYADMETLRRHGQRWMAGGLEVDREITERFGDVLERTRRGELDHWAETPRGRLALIIVLDQFSRNIHRGSPLSYSQDKKALELALEGYRRHSAETLEKRQLLVGEENTHQYRHGSDQQRDR